MKKLVFCLGAAAIIAVVAVNLSVNQNNIFVVDLKSNALALADNESGGIDWFSRKQRTFIDLTEPICDGGYYKICEVWHVSCEGFGLLWCNSGTEYGPCVTDWNSSCR